MKVNIIYHCPKGIYKGLYPHLREGEGLRRGLAEAEGAVRGRAKQIQ